MNKQLLGERIRLMRQSAGFTGQQLAEKVTINRTQISTIETGRNNPSLDALRELCEACNLPLHQLLDPDFVIRRSRLVPYCECCGQGAK